jgi:hypothetical protein
MASILSEKNTFRKRHKRMAPANFTMTSKEDLVDKISKILKADGDLDFLFKLAPKELVVLTAHLKNSMGRGE